VPTGGTFHDDLISALVPLVMGRAFIPSRGSLLTVLLYIIESMREKWSDRQENDLIAHG
jgi:hypothetical protein